MIHCVDSDDRGNDLKMLFSSSIGNYKLTPTTLANLDMADDAILNERVALKVVAPHKIKDSFVSKNLEREPTIMEKLNHPSTVSLQEVVFVNNFY